MVSILCIAIADSRGSIIIAQFQVTYIARLLKVVGNRSKVPGNLNKLQGNWYYNENKHGL